MKFQSLGQCLRVRGSVTVSARTCAAAGMGLSRSQDWAGNGRESCVMQDGGQAAWIM
jgi:hypothetical protein